MKRKIRQFMKFVNLLKFPGLQQYWGRSQKVVAPYAVRTDIGTLKPGNRSISHAASQASVKGLKYHGVHRSLITWGVLLTDHTVVIEVIPQPRTSSLQ